MNAINNLFDFVKTATSERKYAENTARGLNAALKLFEQNLSAAEKESLDTFEKQLDIIANDIYSKQKDGAMTSSTLLIYKRRIRKVISDYRTYGSDPGKMAAWNPRRSASALKTNSDSSNSKSGKSDQAVEVIEAQPSNTRLIREPVTASSTTQGGITAFDMTGRYIETNRSELALRENFRVIIELPADLTIDEASKLKRYIELMAYE